MDQIIIKFKVEDQEMKRLSSLQRFARGTKGYIFAVFELGSRWEGFDRIVAVWTSKNRSIDTEIRPSEAVEIPSSVLEDTGILKVNLYAEEMENGKLVTRLTSRSCEVLKSDYTCLDV